MRYFRLADDGETAVPCELMEWAAWFENRTPGGLGDGGWSTRTEVGDLTVSTVFLGTDYRFSGVGPPIVWETMVFGGIDERQERHSTKAEALAYHKSVVEDLRREQAEAGAGEEGGGVGPDAVRVRDDGV